MKTSKISLSLWLFLAGSLALASCTKNTTTTIVPLGTEYYIKDIYAVIPNTAFWNAFGAVQEGPFPPNIEGNYVVGPKQRVDCSSNVAADWPLIVEPSNLYLRFSCQHNGIMVLEMNETTDNTTDTVYVKGNGETGDFMVYFVEEKVIDNFQYQNTNYTLKTRQGVAMKGKVTETGLKDFRYATIILGTESEPTGAPLQEEGTYFIYKDGDNLATRTNW